MDISISISNPAAIKVADAGWIHNNIITLSIDELHIELSEDNYQELKRVIKETENA